MNAVFLRAIEIDHPDPIDWIAGCISKVPLSTSQNIAGGDVETIVVDWAIAGGYGRLRYRIDREVGTPFAADGVADTMPFTETIVKPKKNAAYLNFNSEFDAERWRDAVVTFMAIRFLQVSIPAVMIGSKEIPFDEKFVVGLPSNPDEAWSALRDCGYCSVIEAAFRPEVISQSHYF